MLYLSALKISFIGVLQIAIVFTFIFPLREPEKRDKPRKAWTKVLGVHMNDLHIYMNDAMDRIVNGGYWVMTTSVRVTETVKIFTEEHGLN